MNYSGNASGGTLTVSEGSTVVNLTIAGTNIGTFVKAGLDSLGTGLLIHDPPADSNTDVTAQSTVDSSTSADVANGSLGGVNAGDSIQVTPAQNSYAGALTTVNGSNGGVDWHFSAAPGELEQLADHTQVYTIEDQSNSTSQNIAVSIGANDQFQFQIEAGSGAHSMVNFSVATDQTGAYVGETIDLANFTNSQGVGLTLNDVLADLTTDSHGNAAVNLGNGDCITFQHIAQSTVSAQAAHIFIAHANVV